MVPATPCACATCTCEVQISQAVVRDGQSFCSEVCATGHPSHSPVMAVAPAAALARSEAIGVINRLSCGLA